MPENSQELPHAETHLYSQRRYAYDGWNLVAEIVASPTPFVRTYVWGLDLSVTEQGAGGVGGLLAIQENGESHYPAYDGNGNVMALVRGSDGAVSGRYESPRHFAMMTLTSRLV